MSGCDYLLVARDNAIEKSRSESLPDAALTVAHHNIVRWAYPPVDHSVLTERFGESEAAAALSKAEALLRSTYDVGDGFLANRFSYEECIAQLRSAFPGFNCESYEQALSYGCFLAK